MQEACIRVQEEFAYLSLVKNSN